MELNSPDCTNSVPHEGIVIKKEDMHSAAWKLKAFKFIDKEGNTVDLVKFFGKYYKENIASQHRS